MARRWPAGVYGTGSEPDPRFTLANERTFLAWIRTALAVLAAAVALDALGVPDDERVRTVLTLLLTLTGLVTPAAAYARWAASERAMRHGRPLAGGRLIAVLTGSVVVVAAALAVVFLVSG